MPQKLRQGLTAEHFAHPLDRAGEQRLIDRLTSLGIIKNQIDKLQSELEEEFYLVNLADNTKLSESQGGSVYRLVREVSETLGIPTPNVFVDCAAEFKAYALGGKNSSVVFTSGLIDAFPEPELRAVIAHELGHIICGHTFYRLLAEHYHELTEFVNLIPFLGGFLSIGWQLSLFDWYRKSELTADRSALLGTQDIKAVQNSILCWAGGSSRLASELKVPEFLSQAKEFQEKVKTKREQGIQERTMFLFSSLVLEHAMSTHTWPAVRLQEVSNWAGSRQYGLLVVGDYTGALTAAPPPGELGQIAALAPVGEDFKEDVKEYVKDIGRATGSAVKGFFKRINFKRLKPFRRR